MSIANSANISKLWTRPLSTCPFSSSAYCHGQGTFGTSTQLSQLLLQCPVCNFPDLFACPCCTFCHTWLTNRCHLQHSTTLHLQWGNSFDSSLNWSLKVMCRINISLRSLLSLLTNWHKTSSAFLASQ